MQTSYSYLDVVGRTTVVLKKNNVVGEHNVPFQVLVNIPMKPKLVTTTRLNCASILILICGTFWQL